MATSQTKELLRYQNYQNKLCPVPSTTNYVLRVQTLIVSCLFLLNKHIFPQSVAYAHIHGRSTDQFLKSFGRPQFLRKLQRVDRCVHPKFGDARHQISLVLAVCLRGCHDKYLLIIVRNCEEDAMVHNQHSRHIGIVYRIILINNNDIFDTINCVSVRDSKDPGSLQR